MRTITYVLSDEKSSLSLKMIVKDRFGKHRFTLGSLKGWRGELAAKHIKEFEINPQKWDEKTRMVFVAIHALRAAKTPTRR